MLLVIAVTSIVVRTRIIQPTDVLRLMKEFPGIEEREKLRPARQRNYRVKFRDGYRCMYPGCGKDSELLVVQIRKGDVDDAYTTRCQRHLKTGSIGVSPGQWIELI